MKSSGLHFSDHALLMLILPIGGELLLHYTVGIADSMMVASVGEAAVSGVSLMDFVISFFNSILTALAFGGGVVVGQQLGAGGDGRNPAASLQTVLILLNAGLLLMGAAIALSPWLTGGLFGPLAPEVKANADVYIRILVYSLPFMGLYSAGAAIFRAYGNTSLPLRLMTGANVLNVAGNAVAIYLMGAGTAGVAVSTLVARILAAVLILALLSVRLHRAGESPGRGLSMSLWRVIVRLGLPYCFENGMFYLGRVLVLMMVASFGTAAIAANAVAQAIVLFQVLPGMAAVTGITVVVSRCVGAGSYHLARFYTRRIVRGIYLGHVVSCVAVCTALPLILDIYGLPPETTALARTIVLIHAAFTLVVWPASYALPATFRAAGDTRFPMIVSVVCMLLCRVAFSWMLGVWAGMGVVGVWLGMFGDWIVKGVIFLCRYNTRAWEKYRIRQVS